jgi:hypothetical protein
MVEVKDRQLAPVVSTLGRVQSEERGVEAKEVDGLLILSRVRGLLLMDG